MKRLSGANDDVGTLRVWRHGSGLMRILHGSSNAVDARAAESGELTPRRAGPIESVFTDEAREIVAVWRRDGGYERALTEIAAADPDLAVQ